MYLYVIVSANGLFKIGKANKPKIRLRQIQGASPVECEILTALYYDESIEDLEKDWHERFSSKQVRGEWFSLSKDDLLSVISNESVRQVIEEIDGWGFFSLGLSQLFQKIPTTVLWRISQLPASHENHKQLAANLGSKEAALVEFYEQIRGSAPLPADISEGESVDDSDDIEWLKKFVEQDDETAM